MVGGRPCHSNSVRREGNGGHEVREGAAVHGTPGGKGGPDEGHQRKDTGG